MKTRSSKRIKRDPSWYQHDEEDHSDIKPELKDSKSIHLFPPLRPKRIPGPSRPTLTIGERTFTLRPAFDQYIKVLAERHKVMVKGRRADEAQPKGPRVPIAELTEDKKLRQIKFLNLFRSLDRTSQYMIANVLPSASTLEDTFFCVALFNMFKRSATWEAVLDFFPDQKIPPWTAEFDWDGLLEYMLERRWIHGQKN